MAESSLACTSLPGDGEGTCAGDFTTFCDCLVEEDDRGIVSGLDNSDCSYHASAGACMLVQERSCFGPTISASGSADPTTPQTVAVSCVPPTSTSTANTMFGLPGPGRVRSDWFVTMVE